MKRRGLRQTVGVLCASVALSPGLAFAQLTQAERQAVTLEAQQPAPASPDDIVITAGPPPKLSEVTKQAESITRSADVITEPLARYQYPVCPGIIGMPREIAELIVDRIRFNIERVGAPAAHEDGCRANLLVVVTRNGQADIKTLMRSRAYLFGNMSLTDARELEQDAGPVHAWNLISRRGRHGEVMVGSFSLNGVNVPVLEEPAAHSKIYLTTRLDIESGVVLFDVSAINGLTVNQIADYATMRALVDTRPPRGEAAARTILTLFGPESNAPLELSEFDLAYLRQTYSTIANLPAYSKLVGTARDFRKSSPVPRKASATPPAAGAETKAP